MQSTMTQEKISIKISQVKSKVEIEVTDNGKVSILKEEKMSSTGIQHQKARLGAGSKPFEKNY
ncbi:MAG: hypothetical protein IPN26_00150 [Bacteroidetes bacterium]|nr:hypothetical protein [Bacteroidota bacterium]